MISCYHLKLVLYFQSTCFSLKWLYVHVFSVGYLLPSSVGALTFCENGILACPNQNCVWHLIIGHQIWNEWMTSYLLFFNPSFTLWHSFDFSRLYQYDLTRWGKFLLRHFFYCVPNGGESLRRIPLQIERAWKSGGTWDDALILEAQ